MTTLATSRPSITTSTRSLGLWLTAVGVVLAVNAAVAGTKLMFGSGELYSVSAGTTMHLIHYVIWTGGLVALSQLLPRLATVGGADGRAVPGAVLALAGIGAALDACTRFVSAFVSPYLAQHEPGLLDETPDAVLLVPMLATGAVLMAGMAALAFTAWRRGIVPAPAAALLGLAAISIPVAGPLSNVLLGAGLVWLGTATRRRS